MTRRPVRRPVLALAAVLLAAGCGSAGTVAAGPEPAEPPLGAVLDPADGTVPALPIDAYRSSEADSRLLQWAGELRLKRCMADKGFSYREQEFAARPVSPIDPGHLGLVSAGAAAVTGYHRPPGQGQPAPDRAPESGAYNIALRGWDRAPDAGVPTTGGCILQVQQESGNPAPGPGGKPAAALPDDLGGRAVEAAADDRRMKAALADWSRCMKDAGFDYPDPLAPLGAAWPDPVGPDELRTATADVGCKTKVHLLGTWYALQAGYQQELITAEAAALTALRADTERRVEAAKQLLDTAG